MPSETPIVTVEISMYPLQDNYEEAILDFISHMKAYNGTLLVKTNAMSTYIQGPFDQVWSAIYEGLRHPFDKELPMSNIIKIIPRKLPLDDKWIQF